jgi:hypothetical protein
VAVFPWDSRCGQGPALRSPNGRSIYPGGKPIASLGRVCPFPSKEQESRRAKFLRFLASMSPLLNNGPLADVSAGLTVKKRNT